MCSKFSSWPRLEEVLNMFGSLAFGGPTCYNGVTAKISARSGVCRVGGMCTEHAGSHR